MKLLDAWARAINRMDRFVNRFKTRSEVFLDDVDHVRGLMHVGANLGQERDKYAARRLKVLWIEPIPDIFKVLQGNIASYSDQKALSYLMTDADDREYTFNVSNNEGASSSILELSEHRKLWPQVDYAKTIKLRSITLTSLVKREQIIMADYQALVLDTQGSELLVLKGAEPLLKCFRYIKTEVANFESYKGCCQLQELDKFLGQHGFRRIAKERFAYKPLVGSYYDVLYCSGRN